MKLWSPAKRARRLKLARLLDRWAARLRAQVKAHTPRRAFRQPRLVKSVRAQG
jgi:hypothetical protein